MNDVEFLADEIEKRYGAVKRARGCFLYTAKAVRLTDLYQENGRAILGWGGASAFTMLKNVLSRGLTGSFNTDMLYQMDKAMSVLIKDSRRVLVFFSKTDAAEASRTLCGAEPSEYRPWINSGDDFTAKECVVLEPALPWTQGICLLAVKKEIFESRNARETVNGNVRLAPCLLTAVNRSIYNLIAALRERKETEWFLYDTVLTKYWTRKGPYLYIKQDVVSRERYRDFVLHCLDNGVIINPCYEDPSIVPYGADKGVFASLLKNQF